MIDKESFETKYFTFIYHYPENLSEEVKLKLSTEIKDYLKDHEEELNKQFEDTSESIFQTGSVFISSRGIRPSVDLNEVINE